MILTENETRGIPERMKRELIRGERARAEFAIHAQRQLYKTLQAGMAPQRHMDGIGMRHTTISRDLAARIRVKYNTPGNIDCLHDPEFIRALLRDNPFLRCSSVAGKLALRVDGFRDDSRRPENAGRDKGNAGHGAQPAVDAAGREIPATPAPRSPTRRGDVGCLNGRSAGHGTAGVSLVSP